MTHTGRQALAVQFGGRLKESCPPSQELLRPPSLQPGRSGWSSNAALARCWEVEEGKRCPARLAPKVRDHQRSHAWSRSGWEGHGRAWRSKNHRSSTVLHVLRGFPVLCSPRATLLGGGNPPSPSARPFPLQLQHVVVGYLLHGLFCQGRPTGGVPHHLVVIGVFLIVVQLLLPVQF